MLRKMAPQLLPHIKQITRVHPKVDVCTLWIQHRSYSTERSHHVFWRGAAANCTWQRAKPQHYHTSQYTHPFTIVTMTAGSSYQAPLSPSYVTPMPLWDLPDATFKKCHVRLYSTLPSGQTDENQNETKSSKVPMEQEKMQEAKIAVSSENKEEKLTLVQKFKLMFKQYWYVMFPVHLVTSVVWYGSFFVAAKSGIDIVPIMEKIGAGEKILEHLRNGNAGYYAIAYAMYKIATPARYTVTIGGTTISINYLKKRGYIKPVPSSEQLKEMYEGKRDELIEKKEEMKERYQEKREEFSERYQEKREEFSERYQEKREEFSEKYQDMRDRYQDKKDVFRDRVTERKDQIKDRLDESKERIDDLTKKIRKRS